MIDIPWFNVDDGFANSKPVLRIPRRYRCAAIGLWTLAGSWSAKELTDGFIPDHAIDEFASTAAMAEHLVRAGLWRNAEGGWQFEGWAKWQKTKEQVLTFRAAEAERKRKARSGRKPAGSDSVSGVDSDRTEPGVPLGHHPESGQPLPTPSPEPKPSLPLVDLGGGVGAESMILPKRVRDKIEFQHSTSPDRTACWIWTGGRTIQDGITNPTPDRYLYEHFRERIPAWKRLRTSCPNSSCVNPNHMEIRKGRQ